MHLRIAARRSRSSERESVIERCRTWGGCASLAPGRPAHFRGLPRFIMGKIKQKIRCLLAVAAEGSGATIHERATARSLADQWMKKHGLTESDIPRAQVEIQRPDMVWQSQTPFESDIILNDGFARWFKFARTDPYYSHYFTFDPASDETEKPDDTTTGNT